MNIQLAEICGIHSGDGYLRLGKRNEWDISGNVEETTYYDNYVIPLFNSVFKLSIKGRCFKGRNTYGFVIRNKAVVKYANETLEFPNGAKSLIVRIPKEIFRKKEYMKVFLRGYFDTDGCISFKSADTNLNYSKWKKSHRYYPKIQLITVSENLFLDLQGVLTGLEFIFSVYSYQPKNKKHNRKFYIFLNGIRNVNQWFSEIGSNNPSKLYSYAIWKIQGHVPANLSLRDKEKLLKELKFCPINKGP